MTELQTFILSNSTDWEEKLTHEPYNLKVSRDGVYIMFKYNQISSDFNLPIVREARGIIFREDNWKCVCHPFDKFGNYGEGYCPNIDWESVSVQEKVDGSLCKLWYDDGWHISTNGTIDAFKAELNNAKYKTFGDLFMDIFGFSMEQFDTITIREFTYMFELVSPYNRVVIPYNECKLYFLGWRDMNTGKEIEPELSSFADYFDMPKRYELHTVKDVQEAANKLPWDQEGYVVCDKYFNRVKIKSPQYVMAHYARCNNMITPEYLVQIILDGEQKEFEIYASDYAEQLHKVEKQMQYVAHKAMKELKNIWGSNNAFNNRGDYAKVVSQQPKQIQDFLYHFYDDRIFWDYAKSWTASKWLKTIEEVKDD